VCEVQSGPPGYRAPGQSHAPARRAAEAEARRDLRREFGNGPDGLGHGGERELPIPVTAPARSGGMRVIFNRITQTPCVISSTDIHGRFDLASPAFRPGSDHPLGHHDLRLRLTPQRHRNNHLSPALLLGRNRKPHDASLFNLPIRRRGHGSTPATSSCCPTRMDGAVISTSKPPARRSYRLGVCSFRLAQPALQE
jgi:hypothetical protein